MYRSLYFSVASSRILFILVTILDIRKRDKCTDLRCKNWVPRESLFAKSLLPVSFKTLRDDDKSLESSSFHWSLSDYLDASIFK